MNDKSGESYNTSKKIRFKTSLLRSDVCDFSDAYTVLKGTVTDSANERDRGEKNRDFVLKKKQYLLHAF